MREMDWLPTCQAFLVSPKVGALSRPAFICTKRIVHLVRRDRLVLPVRV
jgi:hypothetical protein